MLESSNEWERVRMPVSATQHERATNSESTKKCERGTSEERTKPNERVTNLVSAIGLERVIVGESTTMPERCDLVNNKEYE